MNAVPVAFEAISSCTRSWSQNVAFCLPEQAARLEKNAVLTCLDNDTDALIQDAGQAILFDLGVGSSYVQFCVRTADERLIRILREHCGRSIFQRENPAAAAVLDFSPARVVISALGRIEVATPIPRSASQTLMGPHTHLLPALLGSGHSAPETLPQGRVDCLCLYPEHPAFDKYGQPRPFHMAAHRRFQRLLEEYGPDGYLQEKEYFQQGQHGQGVSGGGPSPAGHAERIARIQASILPEGS